MTFKKNFHLARECKIDWVLKKMRTYPKGFDKPKYLRFILRMLREGWQAKLYVANKVSKYVFVYKGDEIYKIRFSNHKPLVSKELDNDCDFYAGISNLHVTKTETIAKIILKKQ
jgi:hypothetical protein